ncbi:MAG TPA: RluA family pseudouridine synthase [bacterium]|nr:RluA family pseudouridine synthase [bacterium]
MDPSPIPLTVADPFGGQRLDVFLASQLPDLSRARVRKLIDGGRVEAAFAVKAVKANLLVSVGQTFRVTLPPPEPTHLPAQPLALDLLFEDQDLLVINKPAGLVVHPGAGNPDHTLINALVAHCPRIQGVGGVNRPGLVHRLDKDTSGLLVVAKSDLAFKGLVRELKGRHLRRIYLGLVKGRLEGKGKVDAPLGRHPGARNKMSVRPDGGKEAVTHFESIRSGEEASLLMFKLETGRTHQIRVHAQFIKHPIWGDPVYGGPTAGAGRQMLHAFRLTFRHPRTKETLSFLAPPPADLTACARSLGLSPLSWESLDWKDPEAPARPRKKA